MKYINLVLGIKKPTDTETIYRCVLLEFKDTHKEPDDEYKLYLDGTRVVRADPYFVNPKPTQTLFYKLEDDGFTLIDCSDKEQLRQYKEYGLIGLKRKYHLNKFTGKCAKYNTPFEVESDEAAILYVDTVEDDNMRKNSW